MKFGNIFSDGVQRRYAWDHFEEILPRNEWGGIELGPLPECFDQGETHAVNAYATVTLLRLARAQPAEDRTIAMITHDEPELLFAMYNGGIDRATVLEDFVYSANRSWLRMLKLQEGRDLIGLMVSAMNRKIPLIAGLLWYESYVPVAGKIPIEPSGDGGGHTVVVYGCEIEPDGVWFRIRNSLGAEWGIDGNAMIHETAFDHIIGGVFGCQVLP